MQSPTKAKGILLKVHLQLEDHCTDGSRHAMNSTNERLEAQPVRSNNADFGDRALGGRRALKRLKEGRFDIALNNHDNQDRCQVFLATKGRYCSFAKARGKDSCAQHTSDEIDRIACPLDESHTVSRARLEKHLAICNVARGLQQQQSEAWYDKGVNAGRDKRSETKEKWPLQSSPLWPVVLQKVTDLWQLHGYSSRQSHQDPEHDEYAASGHERQGTSKHKIQQDSLIREMRRAGLLNHDNGSICFLELGCGAADLSRSVSHALAHEKAVTSDTFPDVSFVLVDRKAQRHLADRTLQADIVKRIKVDIKDLALQGVPEIMAATRVVVISKHLCGEATDFALRMLRSLQITLPEKLVGIVISLCCHSACEWSSFIVDPSKRSGWWTEDEFAILTQMSSWATNGVRFKDNGEPRASYHYSSLTPAAREEVGLRIKRLLDLERVQFCRNHLGLIAQIVTYVDKSITLENAALIAIRSSEMPRM